jgi:type III secretion system FlhB-like substrate exporter
MDRATPSVSASGAGEVAVQIVKDEGGHDARHPRYNASMLYVS